MTANEVLKFESKKTVNERLKERLGERDEAIKAVIKNENITRRRVDFIEAFMTRSFWGRLRWLILGQ